MATLALFSLGSNIQPERNLPEAARRLAQFGSHVRASQVWQSKPVGYAQQPDFLNAALAMDTFLSADEWCNTLIPRIEQELGRVRDPSNKNAPRTIDIDLVIFGNFVGQVGHRIIPDPDILTRWFVALPLMEVAPEVRHPTDGRTLREIAEELVARADESLRVCSTVRLL